MKLVSTVLVALSVSVSSFAGGAKKFVGRYQSDSEADQPSVMLELKPKSFTAKIKTLNSPKEETVHGKWRAKGDVVTLSSKGASCAYTYKANTEIQGGTVTGTALDLRDRADLKHKFCAGSFYKTAD